MTNYMDEHKRLFTPTEAIKTLPLVRKIVSDILNEGQALRAYADSLDVNLREDAFVQGKIKVIQSFIDELAEIGCYYKDWNFTIGLVDFPAMIDNRVVSLCWRSDEESITYFHPEEEGYSSRKPIPAEYL
ncbi:MAG: DUF2203 domain-containing protein [Ignavibacteriales bacterium]|nr:DUF2203 domain-containing protein [Ignavibacteriales bacterium]